MSTSTISPRVTAALSLPFLLAMAACSGGSGNDTDGATDGTATAGGTVDEPPGEEARSDKQRIAAPDISADELATMAEAGVT